MTIPKLILFAGAFAALALPLQAERPKPTSTRIAADEMAKQANALLQALKPEQQKQASFSLKDDERKNWHYVPTDRKGLSLKLMGDAQRKLAHQLLKTTLSQAGYRKTTEVMSLEGVLAILENNPKHRDPEQYFFSFFGTPKQGGTWAWRFEGHHLSLNYAIVNGDIAGDTPSFLASNPAVIPEGQERAGHRVLANEEDLARAFVKTLTKEQKNKAIIADKAPREILSKEKVKAEHLGNAGIPFLDLTPDQGTDLLKLIHEYVTRNRAALAEADMAEIAAAGMDHIVFAWAGSTEPGKPHYYRVQGPTFLLEYANTQNDAKHVHATWRDFDGDFGEDLLHRHFEQHPHQ